MPTGRFHPIQFVRGGDWANRNESSLLHPGEIMEKNTLLDKDYQTVQLDTGATSATPAGAQAAQQVAYFKDRQAGLVTNDARMGIGGTPSGQIAGVFPCTVTPGNFTALYTGRSRNVNVAVNNDAFVAGDSVVSESAANGAKGKRVAAGTAAAQDIYFAKSRGAAVANVLAVDLDLPDFD